jgi:hypothetical protein
MIERIYNAEGIVSFAEQVELDVFTKNRNGIVRYTFDFYQYKELGLVVAIHGSDGREWHIYDDSEVLANKVGRGRLPKTVLKDTKIKLHNFVGENNPLGIELPNWVVA